MAITAGTKLGPYEVLAPLGAGGMGEVYRAKDGRIGRDVAIKILPANYSESQDRLLRFEQEARTAGLLNHPNLLAIYDVGTAPNGSPYIVSELLEGSTLREKLRTGALPGRKAIEYAIQLASGLAAAHDKGIVHRDLKPENLFITKDGRLKILDFGLAKLLLPESVISGERSTLETVAPLSTPGTILGTMGYMSPEQVRGVPSDHRSDIFAFGVVLYEMLSGKHAFSGNTPADTMSAILQKEPPDLSATGSNASPALERIVRHCLEKEPDQRFQSARDVAFALEAVSGTSDSQRIETLPSLPKSRNRFWKIATTLGFLLAAFAIAALLLRPAQPAKLLEVSVLPPSDTSLSPLDIPQVSPDGSCILFQADSPNGKRVLWVRSLDSSKLIELQETDDAQLPFWSPDSRFVGFFAQGKLKKVEVPNGIPENLAVISDPRGGAWNSKGVILFSPHPGDSLYKINASGGVPTQATTLDRSAKEEAHRFPYFLPDGIHFLYFVKGRRNGIYAGSLDSQEKKFLIETDHAAVYSPAGYLLYYQSGALMAQKFDPTKLQLDGEPFSLLQKVYFNPPMFGSRVASVSKDGLLCFLRGSALVEVQKFDRSGKLIGVLGEPGENLFNLSLSPDGKRLIAAMGLPTTDLWMCDTATGNRFRFTFDPGDDRVPIWSPDGKKVLFASTRSGWFSMYQKNADGIGNEEPFFQSKNWVLPDDWSPDGKNVLYEDIDPKSKYDIWVMPVDTKHPYPLLKGDANEAQARFSPDGKWIAYGSDESGRPEIYVQSFQQQTIGRWQISVNGGYSPRWRGDGKELFFLSLDKKLMSLELHTEGGFANARPQVLFQTKIDQVQLAAFFSDFEPQLDGQTFIVRCPLGRPESISVLINWPTLIKQSH